jgi:acetyltransferase
VLGRAGIQIVAGRICESVDEAEVAAEELGYPVVVKVLHPGFLHKSESGGVRLDLRDQRAVNAAAADLLTFAPGAAVIVQRQVAGTEVIVGGLRDPQFGPTVLVGLGGVFVEALDDIALGLAPLDHDTARGLLAELRGYPVLVGARGTGPADLDALAAVLTAVGDLLVTVPEIAELDLNPVRVGTDGCVAVDWRILIENPPGQD